jgi:hypothetical protein
MSADSQDGRRTGGAQDDPLEEQTQPMATGLGRSAAESQEGADTTTLGTSFAPPVVLEDETIIEAERGLEAGGVLDADADRAESIAVEMPPDAMLSATFAPSSSLHPMLLERIEPSLGRGERLRLDAAHWSVSLGRAEESDIRLYTASASREHATIAGNEQGEWILTLASEKSVLIDGEIMTAPIALEVGMNIILGQDHLRCVTEGLVRREMAAPTAADMFKDQSAEKFQAIRRLAGRLGLGWWVLGAVAAIGIGCILFAWLGK